MSPNFEPPKKFIGWRFGDTKALVRFKIETSATRIQKHLRIGLPCLHFEWIKLPDQIFSHMGGIHDWFFFRSKFSRVCRKKILFDYEAAAAATLLSKLLLLQRRSLILISVPSESRNSPPPPLHIFPSSSTFRCNYFRERTWGKIVGNNYPLLFTIFLIKAAIVCSLW